MGWIKGVVEELVSKYKTNDPIELISSLKIHLIPWDLHEDIQGFYKYNRRNKYIFYNTNLSEEMQRFVCSHELGHAILHPRSNTPFLRNKTFFSVDKIEVEANTFAIELLLPDEYLIEHSHLTIEQIAILKGVPGEFYNYKSI